MLTATVDEPVNSYFITLFHDYFFSSFAEDQLPNIHWYRCKERLKIRERTTFKGDTLEASEEISPQSREILQTFVCCRARIYPDHTNVCKFSATLQGNIFVISLNIFYFLKKIFRWRFFFSGSLQCDRRWRTTGLTRNIAWTARVTWVLTAS